jgi:hypothetical protein
VLRSGAPKSYVKTVESGNKRRHAFCGDCARPFTACTVDDRQSYSLRIGTSDVDIVFRIKSCASQ